MITPKRNKVKAAGELSRLKKRAQELARRSLSEKKKVAFAKWHTATEVALRNYYGEQSPHYQAFINTDFELIPGPSGSTTSHRTAMRTTAAMLGILAKDIADHWPDPD